MAEAIEGINMNPSSEWVEFQWAIVKKREELAEMYAKYSTMTNAAFDRLSMEHDHLFEDCLNLHATIDAIKLLSTEVVERGNLKGADKVALETILMKATEINGKDDREGEEKDVFK